LSLSSQAEPSVQKIIVSYGVIGLGIYQLGSISEIVKIGFSSISFKNFSNVSSHKLNLICQHNCQKIISAVGKLTHHDFGLSSILKIFASLIILN